MSRNITLFTGQYADLPLEEVCKKASEIGYNGLELACWGNHINISKANLTYCEQILKLLVKHNLKLFAISNHLVGQAVCDKIDLRHKAILPEYIWGNGNSAEVQKRAADEMIKTAVVAKQLGINVVNGFTGSSIWNLIYSFPPTPPEMIEEGFANFAQRWTPILDEYQKLNVKFALEVHPTEIAFDIVTAERALKAINYHSAFGFNFDPSHLAYQGVDYIEFIEKFADRILHVHVKDVDINKKLTQAGTFGGYLDFGDYRRKWNFCSPGRGIVNFEYIVRALNRIGYTGPLSIEWEDAGMERFHGANEAYHYIKSKDFEPSVLPFDAAFSTKG